jgi:hypothetical protein
MRKLTKTISTSTVAVLSLFLSSKTISAAGLQIPNPVKFDTLEDIVNFLLNNVLRQVVLLAFVGLLIYGGWVRMTAQDDAKKVESSQKIIVAAIVGFAIIVLAPIIVEFVGSIIGVQGNLIDQ